MVLVYYSEEDFLLSQAALLEQVSNMQPLLDSSYIRGTFCKPWLKCVDHLVHVQLDRMVSASGLCSLHLCSFVYRCTRTFHQATASLTDSHQTAGDTSFPWFLRSSSRSFAPISRFVVLQDQTEAQSQEVKKLFEEYNKMVELYVYMMVASVVLRRIHCAGF